MSIYHIYMYEERTVKSKHFHNKKKSIFQNIIIGFILVLKEFRIIRAEKII